MPDNDANLLRDPTCAPWNKGKLIGAKPPLRPRHVWSIRTRLMLEGRTRDLAMFNLAIDSKLRGCDLVALRVGGGGLGTSIALPSGRSRVDSRPMPAASPPSIRTGRGRPVFRWRTLARSTA